MKERGPHKAPPAESILFPRHQPHTSMSEGGSYELAQEINKTAGLRAAFHGVVVGGLQSLDRPAGRSRIGDLPQLRICIYYGGGEG
nr:hypothetical protein TR92_01180 [Brucella anthropi]